MTPLAKIKALIFSCVSENAKIRYSHSINTQINPKSCLLSIGKQYSPRCDATILQQCHLNEVRLTQIIT